MGGDENADEVKQKNEMQLIERNAAGSELRSYRNPADTGAFTTANAFRSGALATYPATTWARGVTALSFTADATPPATRLVSLRITLTNGHLTESSIAAVALRN